MGERLCVGFESARALWREVGHAVAGDNAASEDRAPLLVRILFEDGASIDQRSLPSRTRITSVPGSVRARALLALRDAHPGLGPEVDACVSRQSGRHCVRGARVHLVTGSYPAGSFRLLGEGVQLASPELTFLQLARSLDEDLLVAYGYEVCGLFARDGAGPGFCNCPALTSRARIADYLDRLERVRRERGEGMPPGLRRARRALERVRDGAASPEEAVVSEVLFSPRRLGGFGLPPGRLNAVVRLSRTAADLFGMDSFVCDVSWDGAHVALEYQGSQHKLRTRHTYDLRKGNVLGADDRVVVRVDRAMLGRQDLMEEVAKSLSRALGLRWREPDAGVRTRQMRLRRKLLLELEGR